MPAFRFNEEYLSQLPALMQLVNLGYQYLTPTQALDERGGRFDNVLLENTLRAQLTKINRFKYKKQEHEFSEESINKAIEQIKNIRFDGLVKTNEKIYDWLTLGTALDETIGSDIKSFTLNYIDWQNPSNNVFHATAEFSVDGAENNCRPDIVLFVNGIPFAVVECKAPNIAVEEGVSQMIRNQKLENIPRLFIYAQILMSVNKNKAHYATVGTAIREWGVWREDEISEEEMWEAVNAADWWQQADSLFSGDFAKARSHFEQQGARQLTEQDRAVHCLLSPARLLEIARRFTVFDGSTKKIARYQQFFTARNALVRVQNSTQGGTIWHTQGSGKSLSMVWIARLLIEAVADVRIIVVTDRVDLDKQIEKVFRQCGVEPKRAATGENLVKLIQARQRLVTTLVHKFGAVREVVRGVIDEGDNLIALVDESHRTQYGELSAQMRKMLPKARFIGFTGTPLTKKERNTFAKFGEIIQPTYPPRQALEDKAIVPLLYEGRSAVITQDPEMVDLWFERQTSELNEKEKADLKRKYARANQINKAERVIYMRAFDISGHYAKHWQGTGFKAQLVAENMLSAVRFHKYFKEFGKVSTEVVISAPDTRRGHQEVDEGEGSEVNQFWQEMMRRFNNSEEAYNERIIENFKSDEKPEILIVVNKLLTGFDAPRNAVLYLCKPLYEHTLLQAIARVNRLHEGKDYGYIVDYEGIFKELKDALTAYDALKNYDEEDLERALISIDEEINNLPRHHDALWGIFSPVRNKKDEEEYEQLLIDDELRSAFYDLLSVYARSLAVALSSEKFLMGASDKDIKTYKGDLAMFEKLRQSVGIRYSDKVDYGEYEAKIRKLLDNEIRSDEVKITTPTMPIYDGAETGGDNTGEPEQGEYKQQGEKARADTIAFSMKRTLRNNEENDPEYYERFSKMIQDAIDNLRDRNASDYLQKIEEVKREFESGVRDDVPKEIRGNPEACAYFGVVKRFVGEGHDEVAAAAALCFMDIFEKHVIVDFWRNDDAQKGARNDIEDYLYDEIKEGRGIALEEEQMDEIIHDVMKRASRWRRQK